MRLKTKAIQPKQKKTMKKKYTRKQILESIKYWKNQLNESTIGNEVFQVVWFDPYSPKDGLPESNVYTSKQYAKDYADDELAKIEAKHNLPADQEDYWYSIRKYNIVK